MTIGPLTNLDSNNSSKSSLVVSTSPSIRKNSRDTCSINSETSNSSNGCDSIRKPASYNQIQDLYSALQDLVKNNVTSNIPEFNDNTSSIPIILMQTNTSSFKNDSDNTAFENINSILNLEPSIGANQNSSSLNVDYIQNLDKKPVHKRGYSLSTLGDMNIDGRKLKKSPSKSPVVPRKLSQGLLRREKTIGRSRTSSNSGAKQKKDSRESKTDKESKKSWSLISRFRSKSTIILSDPDQDVPDKIFKPKDLRRYSDGSVLDLLPDFKSKENTKKKFGRKQSLDICRQRSTELEKFDELVASLSIKNDVAFQDTPYTSYKSPLEELNKLESWFEMAAAEALKQSNDELSYNSSDSSKERKRSAPQRTSFIKREQSVPKRERKLGQSFGSAQVRSTPNLLADLETINNLKDMRSPSQDQKDPFKNDESSITPDKKVIRSQIKFDEESSRFPKSPLFYTPYENCRDLNYELKVSPRISAKFQVEFLNNKDKEDYNPLKEQNKIECESQDNVKIESYEKKDSPTRNFASVKQTCSNFENTESIFLRDEVVNKENLCQSINESTETLKNFPEGINGSTETLNDNLNILKQDKKLWNRFKNSGSKKEKKKTEKS